MTGRRRRPILYGCTGYEALASLVTDQDILTLIHNPEVSFRCYKGSSRPR